LTHGVVLRDGGIALVATPDSEGRPIVVTVTLTAPDGGRVSWVVAFTDVADAARLPGIVRSMEADLDAARSESSGCSCRGYGPDPLQSNP
jgi:hypothetical protein